MVMGWWPTLHDESSAIIPARVPGADYYDRHLSERVTRRALQTLERQGYRVTLEPAA